jgi:preprotein translocase subunit SecA
VDPSFTREAALKEESRLSRTEALRESRRDRHLTLVEDAVAAMEWWAAFEDSSTSAERRRNASNFAAALAATAGGTPQRSERKVGRNEPCPCGSGRKYKRCCGQ